MNAKAPRRTPLFDTHTAANAKMTEFAGWAMPIRYGSQVEEHRAVRASAGMFDVSHMTVVDFRGAGTTAFLRHVLANDVTRLKAPGQALYSALLNAAGGIIDDVIIYRRDEGYRVVSNAATRDRVITWYAAHAERFDTALVERDDVALIAVQGPEAVARFTQATGLAQVAELKRFHALEIPRPNVSGGDRSAHAKWMIARTGYTGEDGVEVMLPARDAPGVVARIGVGGRSPRGSWRKRHVATGSRPQPVWPGHG